MEWLRETIQRNAAQSRLCTKLWWTFRCYCVVWSGWFECLQQGKGDAIGVDAHGMLLRADAVGWVQAGVPRLLSKALTSRPALHPHVHPNAFWCFKGRPLPCARAGFVLTDVTLHIGQAVVWVFHTVTCFCISNLIWDFFYLAFLLCMT